MLEDSDAPRLRGLGIDPKALHFQQNGATAHTARNSINVVRGMFGTVIRTFNRIYSLFKSERLSANNKLTLHKALIRFVMTYACPAWEFAADKHLLKLQRLQNRDLRSIGNFPRHTPVRELRKAFCIPYIYDYTTKLYRQQA
jgi:hypothetical protein